MANYQHSQPYPTGSQWIHPVSTHNQPTMQDLARAFPRPRHTRVMKPRSAGNSPSSATRRRSTVNQHVMQAMPSQYQSSLEEALFASRNSRPISWHPSSARTRGLSNPQCYPDFNQDSYASMGISGQYLPQSVYGDNMMSYPMTADSTFSPNNYFPVYSEMQEDLPLPQQTPALSMAGSQVEPMGWDSAMPDFSAMNPTSDNWSMEMLSMGTNIPPPETNCPSYVNVPSPGEMSGPSTPDFLPIQQFEDPFQSPVETKKAGKGEEELVGMGLYSQPNGTLAKAPQSKPGTGLKLEETFTPSDEDKDAEGEEDIECEEQQPSPQPLSRDEPLQMPSQSSFFPKQSKQTLNLLQRSFFFDQDEDQQAMAAQPFANLNQPCQNYGYGWI
ncbi:unnamed protein product [Penicillium salamii]|uniref:Uncharacterized protein n=1 Tax=Penicillium salamii TaxID=1612424 RepID=A0A9W4NCS0_9EURO|nr:unnamed protein product [Penicillium salamii]CAG8220890.1 unnamed protein product [Penicillium salamii]CAG8230557.1 unnamed protein product [Penicillium salamii]CAG8324060.1 unnamed protein product [Penicillium salamii]CAG8360744.1 unnamed protein product [Penicillium salamii]